MQAIASPKIIIHNQNGTDPKLALKDCCWFKKGVGVGVETDSKAIEVVVGCALVVEFVVGHEVENNEDEVVGACVVEGSPWTVITDEEEKDCIDTGICLLEILDCLLLLFNSHG